MRRALLAALSLLAAFAAWLPACAAESGQRLLLVTLDGLSWTEVFRGADPARAVDKAVTPETDAIRKAFVDPPDRARALMPFLHEVVAAKGVLVGDQDHGSCFKVANDQWFSYPGYNEILTGRPDPAIVSNEHGANRNVTVLEWLNRQPGFKGRVEAVASWANFGDIINAGRSGVPVNAGWDGAPPAPARPSPMLARLQRETPRHWSTVRFDAFTQAHALEALKTRKPRVLYVSFGETDDFAHDGRYDQTLWAARRADGFIAELWAALQADPAYAGKTTLIVTTDHGRGLVGRDGWKSHGRIFQGSDGTWLAAIGPGVVKPAPSSECGTASQVAATGLSALGLDWRAFDPKAGPPLPVVRGK